MSGASSLTTNTFTANDQRRARERASATPYASWSAGTPTAYSWNPYGELCGVASTPTSCASTPTTGTSYTYNGDGLRVATTSPTSTTTSTWDVVSGGSIPLNINDATTSSGVTT